MWEQAWFLAEKNFSDTRLRAFCQAHGRKPSTFRKRQRVGMEFPRGTTINTQLAFGVYEALLSIPTEEDRLALLHEHPAAGGIWTIDRMKKRVRQWMLSDEGKAKLSLFSIKRTASGPNVKHKQGMRVGTTPGGMSDLETYISAEIRDNGNLRITVLNPNIRAVADQPIVETEGEIVIFLRIKPAS